MYLSVLDVLMAPIFGHVSAILECYYFHMCYKGIKRDCLASGRAIADPNCPHDKTMMLYYIGTQGYVCPPFLLSVMFSVAVSSDPCLLAALSTSCEMRYAGRELLKPVCKQSKSLERCGQLKTLRALLATSSWPRSVHRPCWAAHEWPCS